MAVTVNFLGLTGRSVLFGDVLWFLYAGHLHRNTAVTVTVPASHPIDLLLRH